MQDAARNLELLDFGRLFHHRLLESFVENLSRDATMYTPLDSSKAEFRLIQLVQTDNADEIVCQLKPHSLHDDHGFQYKALSYRLGDDEPTHPIKLDGELVLVRGNLYSFLRQMHKEKRFDWWFFIDALCINQADDEEKPCRLG